MISGLSAVLSDVIYKDIPNFPGYRAGADGSIWSCWGRTYELGRAGYKPVFREEWKKLKINLTHKYARIFLAGESQGRCRKAKHYVHRIILETFVGPCPEGMQCLHYDGNCRNNELSNLRWGTPTENGKDQDRHGTRSVGEKRHCAKLTALHVRNLYAEYAAGRTTVSALATKYKISVTNIQCILRRKTWKHLPLGPALNTSKDVRLFSIPGHPPATLLEWAKKRGVSKETLKNRIHLGWSVERMLTEPLHKR